MRTFRIGMASEPALATAAPVAAQTYRETAQSQAAREDYARQRQDYSDRRGAYEVSRRNYRDARRDYDLRLAAAPVDAYGRDYRYVRVCPDENGRYRVTG